MHTGPEKISEISVSEKRVTVIRIAVELPVLDDSYDYVELVIDGESFGLSRPDAQVLGQRLQRAVA